MTNTMSSATDVEVPDRADPSGDPAAEQTPAQSGLLVRRGRRPARVVVAFVVAALSGVVVVGLRLLPKHQRSATPHTSVQVLAMAAGSALSQGNLPAARALYERASSADPRNGYLHYDLGVVEQRQADTASALEQYRTAVRLRPGFVRALFNEATLVSARDPSEAASLYRQVIAFQPVSPTAHLNLGLLLAKSGHISSAASELTTAVHEKPSLLGSIPADDRVLLGATAASPPVSSKG